MSERTSILMVCLGNICRSPIAECVMKDLVAQRGLSGFHVASCGTGGWHAGEPAHEGSRKIVAQHGLSLEGHRARQLAVADLERFDWLVAMDTSNRSAIGHLDRTGRAREKTVLLLDFLVGDGPRDVPDPYYVGGFDVVYDLVRGGCEGLLDHIVARAS